MTSIVESIRAEYVRYKALAEAAIAQLSDDELLVAAPHGGNSIAVICWHVSGNLQSRFTEFLTSDGEKSWRNREEELAERTVTRAELLSKWDRGWEVLLATLATLTDEQLAGEVTRTEPGWPQLEGFPVKECLHIVLNEEWEHRLYAERDLSTLEKEN